MRYLSRYTTTDVTGGSINFERRGGEEDSGVGTNLKEGAHAPEIFVCRDPALFWHNN